MNTRFQSRYYPESDSRFRVIQEHAMHYYAMFALVVMILVMLRIISGGTIGWWVVIPMLLTIAMGNIAGSIKLKKTYAQIFFVGEYFSLISVYDILYEQEKTAFPLKFASAHRGADTITLHYNDTIITLHRKDWTDFELIWQWLNYRPENEVNVVYEMTDV